MAPKQKRKGAKTQSKHTVKLVPTFKKKKVKVGRSLPKGVNDTKVNVQTRSIVILQQFANDEKDNEAGSSGLMWATIQPILAHFTHHNLSARRNAVSTFRNKLKQSGNASNSTYFNEILRSVCPLLSDSDEQCRKLTNEVLKLLIESHSESELRPFEALIVANLNVALTSADNSVRRDALFDSFDMLIAAAPKTVRRHAATLLRNVIEMTTKRIVLSTKMLPGSGGSTSNAEARKRKSAAESNTVATKCQTILASTEGAVTSLRNRARLLERLRTLFTIAIGGDNGNENESESENAEDCEIDQAAVRELCMRSASQFATIALQIVVEANETLANFDEDAMQRGAVANTGHRDASVATDCLLNALRILNELLAAFGRETDVSVQNAGCEVVQFRESLKPFRKDLLRHVLRRFPFADASLDDQVCRLVLHFYTAARTGSQRAAFRDALVSVTEYIDTRTDQLLQSLSNATCETTVDDLAALTRLVERFSTECAIAQDALRAKLIKVLELGAKRLILSQVQLNADCNHELIERLVRVLDSALLGRSLRSHADPLTLACYAAVELLPTLFIVLQLDCNASRSVQVQKKVALVIRRCLVDRVLRLNALDVLIQPLINCLKQSPATERLNFRVDSTTVELTEAAFLELANATLPFVFYTPSSCDLQEERRLYIVLSQLISLLHERRLVCLEAGASWLELCKRVVAIVSSRFERCVTEQSCNDVQVQFLPSRLASLFSFFLTVVRDAVHGRVCGESSDSSCLSSVVALCSAIRDALNVLNDLVRVKKLALTREFVVLLTSKLGLDAGKLAELLKCPLELGSANAHLISIQLCALLTLSCHLSASIDEPSHTQLLQLAASVLRSLRDANDSFSKSAAQFIQQSLRTRL